MNEQIGGAPTRVEGTLKMTAPLTFGLIHLTDVLHDFAHEYTDLNFELDFSDRHIDLVEEGYELAIRISELQDSSYQARRLALIRFVLCASPDYLNTMGTPEKPEDLARYEFLQYSLRKQNMLQIISAQGQKHTIKMNSKIKASDGTFLVNMAARGHGMIYIPTFIAHRKLASGELVPVLKEYQLPTLNAYAIYPKIVFCR